MDSSRYDAWFPINVPASDANARGIQLFCFPHAGGCASFYRDWVPLFGPGIDVIPVQLPGREARFLESPITSAAEVISRLLPGFLERADRTFALFGHSMGALLAFELAHALACVERPPYNLFVSGLAAPHLKTRLVKPALHSLPDDELIRYIGDIGGIPKDIPHLPELFRGFLPVLRADLSIYEEYKYSARDALVNPITVFGADDDPTVGVSELHAWRSLSDGETAVHLFQGDHFFLNSKPKAMFQIIESKLGSSHGELPGLQSLR